MYPSLSPQIMSIKYSESLTNNNKTKNIKRSLIRKEKNIATM